MEQHNETVIVLSFFLINAKVPPHSEAFLLLQGRVNNYTLIVKSRTDVLETSRPVKTPIYLVDKIAMPLTFFTSFNDGTTALALSVSQASCLTLFLHSRNDIPI
jgi:hypothetical protein